MKDLEKSVKIISEKLISSMNEIMTSTEAAEFCKTTKRNLLNWVHNHGLRASRVPGNEYRFLKMEIIKWMEKRATV